jgi:hypothetical protein
MSPAWRALSWLLVTLSGVAGLWSGYDFGNRLGGVLLGVFLAVVGALIASSFVDGALDWLLRARSRGAKGK